MATKTDATQNRTRTVYGYYRVSSEPQTWGDGEHRQDQQLKDWCARKGYALSDRRFSDSGVSAWKGKNRQAGAFAQLLKLVKPGNIIAIEDNDRFSRERTIKSLAALEEIVNRGITVAFLKTGVEVTKDNFNDASVIIPNFFQAYLANQENEKRSYRIREAMKSRRAQVEAGKAVPGRLACWLQWDRKENRPVVIKEKAHVVNRVFKMCLAGHGVRFIEKALREVPPIANSKRANWNSRFIHRLLTDRSVLGEHVATKTANIFPAIIEEPVFLRAGEKLKARRHQTVREAWSDHNLFTGLARCCGCNSTLVRHSTRTRGRAYTYLLCSGRLRGRSNCTAKGLDHGRMEQSFLSLLKESGLIGKLLSSDPVPSPVDDLERTLADVKQRADKIAGLIEGEEGGDTVKRLAARLKELEAQENQLQQQIDAEAAKAKDEVPARDAFDRFQAEFGDRLHEPGCRLKLRDGLHSFVEKIVVNLEAKLYHVHLKGAAIPITVSLHERDGWLLNPAPGWVIGCAVGGSRVVG